MQNFIKRQVQVKNDKAVNAFAEEQEQSMKAQALLDQQEKNFYSYAERCIKEWQDAGKNVKPLVMELKNYKKRIV